MFLRRAALALTVVGLLVASLMIAPGARAQLVEEAPSVGDAPAVEEAQQRADQADAAVESAYQVVNDQVANRDEIESQLLAALDRYAVAAAALENATIRLDRLERTAAAAATEAIAVQSALEEQAVAAYINAMSAGGGLIMASESAADAMVTEQLFDVGTTDGLEQVDALTTRRTELDRLLTEYATERDRVAQLETDLKTESDELDALFQRADTALAEAYRRAQAADATYRASLSSVERARAAEEADRAATSTTDGPSDTGQGDNSTTSTAPSATDPPTTEPPPTDPPAPPPPVGPNVERWRPLVTTHFAADLVDDALVIIGCESNGDPEAVNPYSGASGLFQFLPSTWAVASVKAGVGDRSVFDGEANIISAAWLTEYYRSNGASPWAPWACRNEL